MAAPSWSSPTIAARRSGWRADGLRVIHVMTHDSIGLGEDGPTHQPVEHLAACAPCRTCWCSARPTRSRPPNAGSWRWTRRRPSVLALTRQNLPRCASDVRCREQSVRAAPMSWPRRRASAVSIFATGSEVVDRVAAQESAGAEKNRRPGGLGAVLELLAGKPAYRAQGHRRRAVKVAVEAAVRFGWDALISARRRLRRHDRFRRQRAGQGALQAFRHHRRGGRLEAASRRRTLKARVYQRKGRCSAQSPGRSREDQLWR
jgi:transketolase